MYNWREKKMKESKTLSLDGEIQKQIDHTLAQMPSPELVTLIKVYDDTLYGDVRTVNDEIIEYVQLIGGRTSGKSGVLFYLNNDYNQPIAIIDY